MKKGTLSNRRRTPLLEYFISSIWSSSMNLVGKRQHFLICLLVSFQFHVNTRLISMTWTPSWTAIFLYSCFGLILAFSYLFYFVRNQNKTSSTTFKERFHCGAVCGVQRETTTFNFSRQEKQSVNNIWTFRKIYTATNPWHFIQWKLQITYTFRFKITNTN